MRYAVAVLFLFTAVLALPACANRTLTVVNQCKSTIVVNATGGNVQACGANNSCPTGTSCYQGSCFWALPAPATGSNVLAPNAKATYKLTAPAIQETVKTPNGPSTIQVKWSGSVYASTGCDANGQNCQTAMCPLSQNGVSSIVPCANGQGPQGPASLAEFTLAPFGPDYYDVTLINGVNVPISMAPASVTKQKGTNAYFCQTPGSLNASNGLLGCSWAFTPPSNATNVLPAVSSGGAACTSSSTCSSGQTCGYSYTIGTLNVAQTCGTQLGWWTADELCTFTNNGFGAPIDCATAVLNQGSQANLYLCNANNAASCYGVNSTTCCGCPSWVIGGKTLLTSMSCQGANAQWTSLSLPWLSFLKNACPTAYTFPFDDATSTFTCNTPNTSATVANHMDYTITFCPGGKQGF
jgi:Thaumatin family